MINKVLSFLIRGGITGVLGFAVGAPLRSIEIASIIWVIGGIYTLSKFNHPFKIVVLMTDKIENKAMLHLHVFVPFQKTQTNAFPFQ